MSRSSVLRVLLVEDNELDARSLTKQLTDYRDADFTITRAVDLAAATALLTGGQRNVSGGESFDCVLLDLSLPDSAGLVSVEALTAAAADCPIVVLTGLDDPSTALEAVEQGAQDYLSKQTADAEVVARSIRYAVARHHSEQALRSATDQLNVLHDRERIARDLHDTVIQQLFATGIGLQSAAATVTDQELNGKLLGAVEGIDAAIRQLREAIFGLHVVPRSLVLEDALAAVAEEQAESLGFEPFVQVGPMPEDLPSDVAHHAVQVAGEALSNVAKHAAATAAKVEARVDGGEHSATSSDGTAGPGTTSPGTTSPGDAAGSKTRGRWLVITVTDNGRGVVPGPERATTDGLTGHGLTNMADRAESLGGRFHVGPGAGGGTRIEWVVPA